MKFSRAYMKNAEFKARQAWLAFEDAVGIVLEILEPVKEAAWAWFREWKKAFVTKAPQIKSYSQLNLFDMQEAKP